MARTSLTDSLTAIVLTKDEAPNIERCLERLVWVPRILVVDSFSTDGTPDLVRKFRNAEVLQREFDSFAGQCNYALGHVNSEWVLSLDADYMLTPELTGEIQSLAPGEQAGYRAAFRYCISGRPLRGSLYPPRTVLYRRRLARYADSGHGHLVEVEGVVGNLGGMILHDDRKDLSRWLFNQTVYAEQEARYLLGTARGKLSLMDRLRLMLVPAPLVAALYVLVAKGCALDGIAGWHYTMQRVLAEVLISLQLADRMLAQGANLSSDKS